MNQYLLLNKIKVQNANALSSPFTFGFPAVTAFLGFAHALQRHLNLEPNYNDLKILGTGIISHEFDMQDYQAGYERHLKLTANPLNEKGDRPSFVEEGRCHLCVSLILEIQNLPNGELKLKQLKRRISEIIQGKMKLAGGDILEIQQIKVLKNEHSSLKQLIPSYFLMERRDKMIEAMQSGQDAFEALHSFLEIQHFCQQDKNGHISWDIRRKESGWLVPIATGFQAISELASDQQSRDARFPHRFAESVITLGEFVMPHRLENLSDSIWKYKYQDDLYICNQENNSL